MPKLNIPKEDEKLKRDDKRASVKSVDNVKKSSTEIVVEKATPVDADVAAQVLDAISDLDSVLRGDRLVHPTADRVKAPKRRPPSSVFVKEAVSYLWHLRIDHFKTLLDPELG